MKAAPYDENYWNKYQALDATPCGTALTSMRMELVSRHWSRRVIDIGIGGGRFVAERPDTRGFDINPHAVKWLTNRLSFFDPYSVTCDAMTFWDSLEHIYDPVPLLNNVRRFVFVSLPIFRGPADILASKHFRRDEHCWYFTRLGLTRFMRRCGFRMLEISEMEQAAGREQIESFVFERYFA